MTFSSEVRPADTVDFIFDHIKGVPAEQLQSWDALDQKVATIFGVGSAIVGLTGLAVTAATSESGLVAILLALALVAYGVGAVTALIHLWPAPGRRAGYGETLWPDAWDKTVATIKRGIIHDVTEASRANAEVLTRKALTLRIVVIAVGVEAMLVGAAFVVRAAT